ncbi:MAG TPA: GNAT family N-acetyltransferase [Candidatus Acidoferrales bacterium]|nr:GNAT family N-acetyltransferase [Candidatus Acidoferrales bacterium]
MSTDDEVTIREATTADQAVLGKMGAALMRVHYDFDRQRFLAPGPNTEAGYGHFLASQAQSSDVVVFVAESDGDIVGYVYAGVEPLSWKELRDRAGFVHDVYVAPQARRQGIAVRLVEAAAEWLTATGVPRVMLWTAEPNGAAQRLFARLGFRRTMIEMTREVTPSAKTGS